MNQLDAVAYSNVHETVALRVHSSSSREWPQPTDCISPDHIFSHAWANVVCGYDLTLFAHNKLYSEYLVNYHPFVVCL